MEKPSRGRSREDSFKVSHYHNFLCYLSSVQGVEYLECQNGFQMDINCFQGPAGDRTQRRGFARDEKKLRESFGPMQSPGNTTPQANQRNLRQTKRKLKPRKAMRLPKNAFIGTVTSFSVL